MDADRYGNAYVVMFFVCGKRSLMADNQIVNNGCPVFHTLSWTLVTAIINNLLFEAGDCL